MTSLLGAALDAPLIGIRKRWPATIHAIEMGQVVDGWERGTFTSACGVSGLRLEGVNMEQQTIAVRFPPRLQGMPSDRDRCRPCWVATGRKRPRVEWVKQVVTPPGDIE